MALQEIMTYISQAGGLAALGLIGRSALMFFTDKRAKVTKIKSERQTSDVDNLSKLLQLTPGEVVRLQEDLAESESRVRTMRQELNAAHDEIASLRGQMSQMSIQLSNALMTIRQLQERNETDGTR